MVTEPEAKPLTVLLLTVLVATACLVAAAAKIRPIAPLSAVDAATMACWALDAVMGVLGPEWSGTAAEPEPVLLLSQLTNKAVMANADTQLFNLKRMWNLLK